jgi:uncharacterized protein
MAPLAHEYDLRTLRLTSGEGRRIELAVPLDPVDLSGEVYEFAPNPVTVQLSVSRMTGGGYALLMDFETHVIGECMRCLKQADRAVAVEAREVERPGGGDELDSPYVDDEQLDVAAWAHDALVLALPAQIVCRDDCAGLCPVCAIDLNQAPPDHHHESPPDPRWAKLSELRLD